MTNKVILCPLYGDIKPEWEQNKELTSEMLKWPIVYSGHGKEPLDDKICSAYRLMLQALLDIENFHSYVGLEIDEKNKRFVFWNGKLAVDMYLDEKKLFQIEVTKGGRDFWYHFEGIVNFYEGKESIKEETVHGWGLQSWNKFLRQSIKRHISNLAEESNGLMTSAVKLNSDRLNIMAKII